MSLIILDNDDLVVRVKDADGNKIEYAGQVDELTVADLMEVTVRDVARYFGRWKVMRRLTNYPIGELIKAIVESPAYDLDTGIVAHVESIDGDTAGLPLVVRAFDGGGRTLLDWISDFCKATGYRWYIETVDGVDHFWCYYPDNAPEWAIVMRDDTDIADDSASQWRVKDGFTVKRTRQNYLNRVKFLYRALPPAPPWPHTSWDSYFSEDVASWTNWGTSPGVVTMSNDAADKVEGSNSLKFTWDGTLTVRKAPGSTGYYAEKFPFAYFRLPLDLRDQMSSSWGSYYCKYKFTVTKDGAPYTNHAWAPVLYWIMEEEAISDGEPWKIGNWPMAATYNRWGLAQGAYTYPYLAHYTGSAGGGAMSGGGWNGAAWVSPLVKGGVDQNIYKNVVALGLGMGWQWGGDVADNWDGVPSVEKNMEWPLTGTWDWDIWIDDFGIKATQGISTDPMPGIHWRGNPDDWRSVETAAVTAGTEKPIEGFLDTTNMTRSEALAMANKMLVRHSRTQTTVSKVVKDGIRAIPLQNKIRCTFPRHGVASETYSLVQAEWKPLDSGDVTELTVGDIPFDVTRSIEGVRRLLSKFEVGS